MVTAVYAEGKIVAAGGDVLVHNYSDPGSWAMLGRLVATAGVDVLYAFHELPTEVGDKVEVEDAGDGWRWLISGLDEAGRPFKVFVVRPEGDGEGISGPWVGCDSRLVWMALTAFERAVGVPWAESIGRTAERLILDTHPVARGGRRLDRVTAFWPEPVLGGNLELPYGSWRRELTPTERKADWVHVFDANAQYLSAWSGAVLGHGEPVHHQAPAFDRRRAGVWRLDGIPPNLRPELPPVALPGREWFTTPTVDRLLEVCDGSDAPMVVEAWIWPEQSRYLRAAAERMRNARDMIGAAQTACQIEIRHPRAEVAARGITNSIVNELALEMIKSLYRVETGRFNMGAREASRWFRPDWGHTIRALARCNLHRRLWQLGVAPFAIATDGLVFASDEPSGRAFAAQIRLPLGDGLGQYRHEATVPRLDLEGQLDERTGQLMRAIGKAAAADGA